MFGSAASRKGFGFSEVGGTFCTSTRRHSGAREAHERDVQRVLMKRAQKGGQDEVEERTQGRRDLIWPWPRPTLLYYNVSCSRSPSMDTGRGGGI
jgi:hypothetical protein